MREMPEMPLMVGDPQLYDASVMAPFHEHRADALLSRLQAAAALLDVFQCELHGLSRDKSCPACEARALLAQLKQEGLV